VTGKSVELAFVDQGSTGDAPARAHGIRLEVVKLPQAKRGFLPAFAPVVRGAFVRLGRALSAVGS
jgi:hypothetical protein